MMHEVLKIWNLVKKFFPHNLDILAIETREASSVQT